MSDLRFFVEYHPNEDQEETVIQMTEMEFIALIYDHKVKGIDPLIDYKKHTGSHNGNAFRGLTIRDEYGIYYN